ncbi:MAG TPA: hypothetical protein DD384_05165, partial [Firmicutes bacterium]|nr:hypothetical protein [Bacillota bacterium]
MKKCFVLLLALAFLPLPSCTEEKDNLISVAASEIPHAEILENAIKPLLEDKGYELEIKVLDWTLQNDGVLNGDYDANYFQHRPYLEQFDSGNNQYDPNYSYKKVFPVVSLHFEPLRIYPGKKDASEFEKSKKESTYEICNDVSNEIRALDLLKESGVIDSYTLDSKGNPINLPENIKPISESLLISSLQDYDYAVLPTNTALTGKLSASSTLPSEGEEVKDLRANVIAANVNKYQNDETYKK